MKERKIPKPSLGFRFTEREEYWMRIVCAEAVAFMMAYGQPSTLYITDEKTDSDGES